MALTIDFQADPPTLAQIEEERAFMVRSIAELEDNVFENGFVYLATEPLRDPLCAFCFLAAALLAYLAVGTVMPRDSLFSQDFLLMSCFGFLTVYALSAYRTVTRNHEKKQLNLDRIKVLKASLADLRFLDPVVDFELITNFDDFCRNERVLEEYEGRLVEIKRIPTVAEAHAARHWAIDNSRKQAREMQLYEMKSILDKFR